MGQETKKEILIIGAAGLLGRAVCKELSKGYVIHSPSEQELDITDRQKTKEICQNIKPSVIVLTAAYTDVDGCEDNPQLACRVNIEGVRHVVEAARENKAILIFMSTDYIFDGNTDCAYTERDKPNPISVYGRSKWQAESIIQANLKQYIIVRSCWLFGEAKEGFVQFVLDSISRSTPDNAKKKLTIVSDKIGSPTYVVDLASAIHELVRKILNTQYDYKENNILHIVNDGACSWYDITQLIIQLEESEDKIDLEEMKLENFSKFKAKRPRYSALDNSKYKQVTGKRLRPWQEALGEFIQCQKN